MANTFEGSWPLMRQLADANINPAMLEAFCQESLESLPEGPDQSFFERAVVALGAAQKALKSGFEVLSMERKVALLAMVLQAGVDEFSRNLKGLASPKEAEVAEALSALDKAAKALGSSKRVVSSLKSNRLVFQDQALNTLRDGGDAPRFGSKSPVMRYIHRLLQVSQQLLGTPLTQYKPFDISSSATSSTLKAFQQKVFKDPQHCTGELDRETLGVLELLVLITEPAKGLGPKKRARGLNIIEQKDHLLKIKFKDFNAFFDFYTRMQLFSVAPAWVLEGVEPPSAKDLQSLLYVLGFIQEQTKEQSKEKLAALEKLFKKAPSSAMAFLREVWRSGWLGKTGLSMGAAGMGLVLYWASMKAKDWGVKVAKGDVSKADELILQGIGALVELVRFKTSPKTDGGLRYKRNTVTVKGGLKSPGSDFKNSEDKTVHGLGAGGELSLTWTRNKRLEPGADLSTLQENGFNDKRVWYCEQTCSFYSTYELRTLFQQGGLGGEVTVQDITSQERAPQKLSSIPVVASTTLYSNNKSAFQVTISPKGKYAWDPKEQQNLRLLGGSVQLEKGLFSLGVSNTYKTLATEYPKGSQQLVPLLLNDLEATLKLKLPVGTSTQHRSNMLEIWTTLKDSQKSSPASSGLDTRTLVTTAGLRWEMVRKDDYTFRMSLQGTYPLKEVNVAAPQPRTASLGMEGVGRDFTFTLQGTFSDKAAPLWSVRIIKLFGNSRR
jgi:hypothetical protein